MKGFIKTLEATIAVLLIISTVSMLHDVSIAYPEKNFMEVGDYCLDKVYDEGNLRYYAVNDLENELEDNLDDCLAAINYKLEICSSMECSITGLPNSTVVLVSRLISGDQYEINPRIINVWMWA